MKKKIFALLLAMSTLMVGVVANAASTLTINGLKDTYAADYSDNLNFSLDIDSISTNYPATVASIELVVSFDKNVLAYSKRTSGNIENGEGTVISFSTTKAATVNEQGSLKSLWVNQDDPSDDTYNVALGSSGTLVNYEFKRAGTGSTTITVDYITFADGDGNILEKINNPCSKTIKFGSTTYPSYSNEETFDGSESFASSDAFKDTTIDANTKAFTVFGKATQTLGIGEYGIKVTANDDKTYTFKGLKEVAKDGLWAIKVVSPDGTFKFADGETLTTKSIQTFEKGTFTDVSMN